MKPFLITSTEKNHTPSCTDSSLSTPISLSFVYIHLFLRLFSSDQSLSCVRLFVTLWTAACQASLSITNSRSSVKLMSIESVMPPTISSFVVPFSSRPHSFSASGLFPMSQLFASGGQNIGVSASASVLPMNIQDWFPLGWTGWISLQSKDSQESSATPQFKSTNFRPSAFLMLKISHPYITTGKTIALTRWTFVSKVMSLLFNTQSRLVIALLPRRKSLLIS